MNETPQMLMSIICFSRSQLVAYVHFNRQRAFLPKTLIYHSFEINSSSNNDNSAQLTYKSNGCEWIFAKPNDFRRKRPHFALNSILFSKYINKKSPDLWCRIKSQCQIWVERRLNSFFLRPSQLLWSFD